MIYLHCRKMLWLQMQKKVQYVHTFNRQCAKMTQRNGMWWHQRQMGTVKFQYLLITFKSKRRKNTSEVRSILVKIRGNCKRGDSTMQRSRQLTATMCGLISLPSMWLQSLCNFIGLKMVLCVPLFAVVKQKQKKIKRLKSTRVNDGHVTMASAWTEMNNVRSGSEQ